MKNPQQFLNDCITAYLAYARGCGFAPNALDATPALVKLSLTVGSAIFKDANLQKAADDPIAFKRKVIGAIGACVYAGIVFGCKYRKDPKLTADPALVARIVEDGPMDMARDTLKRYLGFEQGAERTFITGLTDKWSEVCGEYLGLAWAQRKSFIAASMIAAFRLGVTMVMDNARIPDGATFVFGDEPKTQDAGVSNSVNAHKRTDETRHISNEDVSDCVGKLGETAESTENSKAWKNALVDLVLHPDDRNAARVQETVALLKEAAEKGDASAQMTLGGNYESGKLLAQDFHSAVVWYERALKGGVPAAGFALGRLYEKGLGVNRDLAKARDLYWVAKQHNVEGAASAYKRIDEDMKYDPVVLANERAFREAVVGVLAAGRSGVEKRELEDVISEADAGNPEAQYLLGMTYEQGTAGERDYAKARRWYEKASMNKFPRATMAIGRFFEEGIGEEAHAGTAYEWYRYALEDQGYEEARPAYERMKRKLEEEKAVSSGDGCGINMRRVAIVGVDGSGKTVMLAGLGDLYAHPDANGFFLAPKDFGTSAYVNRQIALMRAGHWPKATVGDELKGLNWLLRRQKPGERPEDVCEVSFLDFAGEVYRAAFGVGHVGDSQGLSAQIGQLKSYVRDADDLIVLINLKDVIAHGLTDRRTEEAMWISNSILEYALNDKDGGKIPRASIVLSQADSYAEIISDCGGAVGTLSRFLPHVANDYSWLDIFAASAVDKTHVDDDGELVPSPDFKTNGLSPVMTWILRGVAPGVVERNPNLFAEAEAEVGAEKKPTDPFDIPIAEIEQELYHSGYQEMTPQESAFLKEAANGDPAAAQRKMKRAAKDWFEKGEAYERRSRWIFFNAKKNYARAVECWTRAAELKYRPAQKKLGDVYYDLDNGFWNTDLSQKWYLLAAKQGEPEAQFEVGKWLNRYTLVPPSDESRLLALKWFRLSADQGHLGSLCQLGCFREHGYCGVKVDDREAYSWYQKAVDGGYKYGATYLIKLHKKHKDYPIDYGKVAPLLQKATANDIESMILYGELLENGLGVAKNLQLALQFYRCAAGDNSDAEVAVARVQKKIREGG